MTCRSNQKGRKEFPVRLPVLENEARLRKVEHHPCANEHLLPSSIGQFLGDPSTRCTCHHSYDVESRWQPGEVFGWIQKQIDIDRTRYCNCCIWVAKFKNSKEKKRCFQIDCFLEIQLATSQIIEYTFIYYPSGEFSNQTIKLALYKQNRHSKLFSPAKHYKTLQDDTHQPNNLCLCSILRHHQMQLKGATSPAPGHPNGKSVRQSGRSKCPTTKTLKLGNRSISRRAFLAWDGP